MRRDKSRLNRIYLVHSLLQIGIYPEKTALALMMLDGSTLDVYLLYNGVK